MTLRRPFRMVIATTVCTFLFVLSGSPVSAASKPVEVSVTTPTVEIEYGEGWSIQSSVKSGYLCASFCEKSMVFENLTTGESIRSDTYDNTSTLSYYQLAQSLNAGTHEFVVKFKKYGRRGTAPEPAVVKVLPAALKVDLRVSSDPNNARGAIVSAQLQGAFVERTTCYECAPAPLPAGSWSLEVSDAQGNPVFSKEIAAEEVASRFASFYWNEIPADSSFTASATFVPEQSMAKNFEIANDSGVQFTSPPRPESGAAAPEVAPVVEKTPEPAEFAVPLWSLLVAGAALVGLLVLALILLNSTLGRSARANAATEVSP